MIKVSLYASVETRELVKAYLAYISFKVLLA